MSGGVEGPSEGVEGILGLAGSVGTLGPDSV